jgi:hypothetical protein
MEIWLYAIIPILALLALASYIAMWGWIILG